MGPVDAALQFQLVMGLDVEQQVLVEANAGDQVCPVGTLQGAPAVDVLATGERGRGLGAGSEDRPPVPASGGNKRPSRLCKCMPTSPLSPLSSGLPTWARAPPLPHPHASRDLGPTFLLVLMSWMTS